MQASHNQYTEPMYGRRRADFAVQRIDDFFEQEAQLSAEDRYREGLQYGVDHGFMTAEEALEAERLFHLGHTGVEGFQDGK